MRSEELNPSKSPSSSFKLIKEGSYTYKREGKRSTSYRVKCRQEGFYIDVPLRGVTSDQDAIKKARLLIAETRTATEREKKAKRSEEKRKENPEVLTVREIGQKVIDDKTWLPTRQDAKYWIEKKVYLFTDLHCPYVSDLTEEVGKNFIRWLHDTFPGHKVFNPRKYFMQIVKRASKELDPETKRPLFPWLSTIEIENPDPKRDAGKVYTDDELTRLYENMQGEDLKLQFLMAISMGMRKSEVLKLGWARIDFKRGVITLRDEDCKIRSGREMAVPDLVLELLYARRKRLLDDYSPYVFPSPKNALKPVSVNQTAWELVKENAKVEGRWHDLRHTFITNQIAKDKKNALDVCIYCGLSLEEMKRTYLHPKAEDTAYIARAQVTQLKKLVKIFGKSFGKRFVGVRNED